MIRQWLSARMQPVRVYRSANSASLLLLRDARYGVLRAGAWVFGAFAAVALLDAANASGGSAINWLFGWGILAAGCFIIARQDLGSARHATLTIRRPGRLGDVSSYGLFVGGLELASGDIDWREFRVVEQPPSGSGLTKTPRTYHVVVPGKDLAVPPFDYRGAGKGDDSIGGPGLLLERCLHPEDAARLLHQLQDVAGAPAGASTAERILPQVNWIET